MKQNIKRAGYGAIQILKATKSEAYFASLPVHEVSVYSALVVGLCVLIGEMARGILFPTLWLFVKSLGGSQSHQGLVVSAFSTGRIISSPIFGRLSEVYGYRYALVACNMILAIGCVLYTLAESINTVLLSQLIIGFGAGSLGVTRAYVAEHTDKIYRTGYFASLTAIQFAGITATPIIGAALSSLAFNDPLIQPLYADALVGSYINQYSLPAVFQGACASVCALLLLHDSFIEGVRGGGPTGVHDPVRGTAGTDAGPDIAVSGYVVAICSEANTYISRGNCDEETALLNGEQQCLQRGAQNNSAPESPGPCRDLRASCYASAITAPAPAHTSDENSGNGADQRSEYEAALPAGVGTAVYSAVALEQDGARGYIQSMAPTGWLLVGGCVLNTVIQGTIGVFETLCVPYSAARLGWTGVHAGTSGMLCGAAGGLALLSFPWLLCRASRAGGGEGEEGGISDVGLMQFGMSAMAASCAVLAVLLPLTAGAGGGDGGGDGGKAPDWIFYASMVGMYSVGYPMGHTALLGVFSKLQQAGAPQGWLLGLFGSVGSCARIFFPLLVGILADRSGGWQGGDSAPFLLMTVLLLLASCFVYTCWGGDLIGSAIGV